MTDFYDALETRSADEREAALLAARRGHDRVAEAERRFKVVRAVFETGTPHVFEVRVPRPRPVLITYATAMAIASPAARMEPVEVPPIKS